MKAGQFLALVILGLVLIYRPANGLEVEGGKIEDVVVASSGTSDSTLVTEFRDGWCSEGPKSFDVDKDGNVYILDRLGTRVVKYNKDGKWVLTFPIKKEGEEYEKPALFYDITVDNWGNVYVTGHLIEIPRSLFVPSAPEGKTSMSDGILKFSHRGEFLFQIPSIEQLPNIKHRKKGKLKGGMHEFILTDKDGKVYNFNDELWGGVNVYSPDGDLEAHMYGKGLYESDYHDMGIVQKEAGNDIYFRHDKYLMRTSVEDYVKNSRIDTPAVLPDWLRTIEFAEDKCREGMRWVQRWYDLIGFDRDSCFYFLKIEEFCNKRLMNACMVYTIDRYHLKDGELIEAGEVEISLKKSKKECSYKELAEFTKQFIVSGDGTIYWLHGTVDTVKVSKIIID